MIIRVYKVAGQIRPQEKVTNSKALLSGIQLRLLANVVY